VRTGRAIGLLIVAVAAAVLVARACDGPADPASGRTPPVVTSVVDGDTVRIDLGPRVETVRLIGIDTPETKHPTKPVGCFGPEASARTAELLAPGTEVTVERDAEERDRYGRLLAYVVRRDDGMFVNLQLAREGYADVLSIAPNTAHAAEFATAVREAREQGRGLWGACSGAVPSGP
jgi:micrococcal nuclease